MFGFLSGETAWESILSSLVCGHLSGTKVAPEEAIGCERQVVLSERRSKERQSEENRRERERKGGREGTLSRRDR